MATRAAIASYTGANLNQPRSITVSPGTNKLLVSDFGNDRVVELSYSRTAGFTVGRAISAGLKGPEGAAAEPRR